MTLQPAFWTGDAAMQRLGTAVLLSAMAHAAVLAGTPLHSGPGDLSLFARSASLSARLAPAPEPAPVPEPQPMLLGVPPVPLPPAAPATPSEPSAQAGPERPAGLPTPEIFYRGSEVDVRAEAINHPDIEYPAAAFSGGVTGVVRLQLKIDSSGALREVRVLEARPAGVFEEAALKAARELRFKPAIRAGAAVGSLKVIEVPFDPDCLRTGSCIPEATPRR
jgi:protein TonB